uniref:Uncharacterized protein n=1 Tax=Knipowitschia caucasica TaxID=637954 RepID=A0AAV2LHW1_KNICA
MWSIAACELSKMADPPPPMQPIVYHIDHKIEEVKEEEEDETEEEVEEEEEDESEEEVEEGKEDEAGGQPQKANRIMRDGAICSININTDHEKWIEEMIKDYPGAGRESPSPGETKINLGEGNDMTLLRQTQ